MWSRLAIKTATGASLRSSPSVAVVSVRNASTNSGDRDLVNFPVIKPLVDRPKVRLNFLPDEWFTQLHSKTGATGGYVLMGTVGTFLLSKELFPLEHEFWTGVAVLGVIGMVVQKAGPGMNEVINKEMEDEVDKLVAVRRNEVNRCKDAIADEENSQWMGTSYETLIAAKKENVSLQLENSYRERLNDAYNQVRRRLDYQLQVSNVVRRVEQQQMVDWIIQNVKSNITAKQEDDALKKCVADLKGLSTA